MHVVKANARMIIRMFHVALLSQRRIAREHNNSKLIKDGGDADNEESDDGIHVLGLDNDGMFSAIAIVRDTVNESAHIIFLIDRF